MRRILLLLAVLALAALGWCYAQAVSDPVVRRAVIALPDWPVGVPPVRVLLWSDLHLGNAATGQARLARIVEQANALRPDLIVIAGDFVGGEAREDAAEAAELLATLRDLRAPLGALAVLGNHDHWTDAAAVRRALEGAGVTVLANAAVRRGPLALGGLDDMVTGHAKFSPTFRATRRIDGARVILSHTPDVARFTPPDMPLLLAGHTHCGQIVLPLYGPLTQVSAPRYRCGLVREGGRTIVVTAGTGTSVLPLRLGAPPDMGLLTLGP